MTSFSPKPAHSPAPEILLACATAAARRAGSHALRNKALRRDDVLRLEANDVKLALDRECQEIVTGVLRRCFPDHSVLGEEDTGNADPVREWNWVVDPIDGTVNFFHGGRHWCCSVAARRGEEVLAGAVFAPELNLLFEASVNTPACCNGVPIGVSRTASVEEALVQTGADRLEPASRENFRFLNRIAAHVQRPRISGSAALDICEVARGGADAYFESSIYLWDIAAADLILRRAGGRAAPLWRYGGPHLAYLGATPCLFDPLCDIVVPLRPKNALDNPPRKSPAGGGNRQDAPPPVGPSMEPS